MTLPPPSSSSRETVCYPCAARPRSTRGRRATGVTQSHVTAVASRSRPGSRSSRSSPAPLSPRTTTYPSSYPRDAARYCRLVTRLFTTGEPCLLSFFLSTLALLVALHAMAMKNLKQSTLSFTPVQKKSDTLPKASQDAPPTVSSSKAAKSQKAKKTSSGRSSKMDYVEIPPGPRGLRATPSTRASSVKSASTRMSAYVQPRRPSTKRKLSPEPEAHQSKEGLLRITVDPASSQPMPAGMSLGKSTRMRFLAPRSTNSATDDEQKPPKKARLSSSSPLSAMTTLPPSEAPSSVHEASMGDVEFVPTSQSDELELILPRIAEKDPSDVQETVDRWRKGALHEPASRAGSPSASDCFGSPLSDVPMDLDYDMFPPPLTIPDTPVAEGRASGSIAYPQTPLSANGEVPDVPSSVAVKTPMSRPDTPSRRAPDVSPSDAFRSLTPPPSSSDIEEEPEPMQEDVPAVKALDVKSKTEQLIADIKARALAAARSSPEQVPVDLEDLSDSGSESSSDDDDGFVAKLMKDTKGKGKA